MKIKMFFIFAAALVLSKALYSVPHKDGLFPGPKDHVRTAGKILPASKRTITYKPDIISRATGTQEIAVILAQFPSADSSTSGGGTLAAADIIELRKTFLYLKNFYYEASYGQLELNITMYYGDGSNETLSGTQPDGTETPVTLNNSMQYYGAGDELGYATGLIALIKDSLSKINSGSVKISSATHATVLVGHAGYGNESTSNAGDIWSAMVEWSGPHYGFTDGATFPAREQNASPIGVTCHEFGHSIGLPDIYATSPSAISRVGEWCLMDYGAWTNNGYNPTHPSVWCKYFLGWLTPITLPTTQNVSNVLPYETSKDTIYKIPVLGSSDEYFLVCYTKESLYNPKIPGSGLLIWHIDEGEIDGESFEDRFLINGINNYSHNTVDIVPADSTHPESNYGDSTDPWPGVKISFTSPESDSYAGLKTGIALANISFENGKANFTATNISVGSTLSIAKLINYPNPAGSGYIHPREASGILTTILMSFTRPPDDLSMTVYTLSGEKIKVVNEADVSLNAFISSDNDWVYEYDWDGKNDSGEDVAPGLYLYSLRADKVFKTGKLAIVR